MSFDLLHEAWLPVVTCDGDSAELGLRQALVEAGRIRRLAGETPTVTAALHRLILALVHRAYGPAGPEEWAELWESPLGLPAGPLDDYIALHPGAFDLLHPQVPFLQCPHLQTLAPATTSKIVAFRATGSNRTLFDHTTAEDRPELSLAQAARWLVTTLAFDTSGTKQPFTRVRTAQGGLANRFATALVEGPTLHQTLLLNTVPYSPDAELPLGTTSEDRPAWEVLPPGPEPDERAPYGWTDVLTWPSRRLLLHTRQEAGATVVDGVVLTPGTDLVAELDRVELMAGFRRPWLKGNQQGRMQPVALDELRGIWRHSQDLLLSSDPRWWNTFKAKLRSRGALPAEEPQRQRPAALDHIAERVEDGLIPEDTVYTLRAFGQRLGDQGGDTYFWQEESVPAPVALMRADSARIGYLLGYAVSLADDLGEALAMMQRDYYTAFHGQRPAARGRQQPTPSENATRYWPRLAAPFGSLLRELGTAVVTGDSETAPLERWERDTVELADRAARRWLDGAPRRDRLVLAAASCWDAYEERRQELVRIYRSGLAAYSPPQEGHGS
ncbi:type I-E CRISPR-associated protein Cse1/CasA [Streptomyces sp. NPDC021020]|uniref:type I-E CRISPR-associated protein Cse1/CasA n=1 Tax=Streptomyces sp. NPDC021020 TaxID=3365109 RepID=UPI0037A68813